MLTQNNSRLVYIPLSEFEPESKLSSPSSTIIRATLRWILAEKCLTQRERNIGRNCMHGYIGLYFPLLLLG
ncbi:hypothetical protein L195_g056644, partial [Trifolium pratense]